MKQIIKSFIGETEHGRYIILDEETREKLNRLAVKTNEFLLEPLSIEQLRVLIGSIIDFYFTYGDSVAEFTDFISYMASFMELLADNLDRENSVKSE